MHPCKNMTSTICHQLPVMTQITMTLTKITMRLKNIKETRKFTFQDERKTRASEPVSGSTRNISGYFAVFNLPSKLIAEMDDGQLRTFYEVLLPESFDDVLASPSLDCI